MKCEEVTALLAADVDGEVDGLRSHAIQRHAAGCVVCGPRREALLSWTRGLRDELPYHTAPPVLRERLCAAHAATSIRERAPAARWRWFGGGMLSGGLLAALVWALSLAWPPADFSKDLGSRIVGLHTRATLGNRLIEIASSDRHTIKPWLSARLDYAIPVLDAAAAGFALVGARIDRLDGRPVATLVYRHREHVIDVFVRPETDRVALPSTDVVRGFNVSISQGAQMQWLATSDLNAADLAAFVQGLARGRVDPVSE